MRPPSPLSVPISAPSVSHWSSHAAYYEQVWERTTTLWGRDALVLGRLPDDPANATFLDVACGTGSFAVEAATLGFHVTATDFSAGMIDHLEAKIAALSQTNPKLNISTRVVDGQTLDGLEDASFDVVSSIFGIFMFADRAAAWRSAMRVLKPGGRLLATSWDTESVNLRMIRYVQARSAATTSTSQPVNVLDPSVNRTVRVATFREELLELGYKDIQVFSLSHPMCFKSGEEYVKGKGAAMANCILDFVQEDLIRSGAGAGVGLYDDTCAGVADDDDPSLHPLWRQPFAIQAIGLVAIATKPE